MSMHQRSLFGFGAAERLPAAAGGRRPGAALGLPDGSVKGGRVVEAVVWPAMEVFLTGSTAALPKAKDPGSGLEPYGFA